MRIRTPRFALTLALLAAAGLIASCEPDQQPVGISFTVPQSDLIPEGIAYDPVDDAFYLSSTYRRKIVRVDTDRRATDFIASGSDGIWGVVGMRVDPVRRHLWVASSHAGTGMPMVNMDSTEEGSSGLFQYNIDSGTFINKYIFGPNDGGHFLNDLTISDDGTVFVTDSRADAVYALTPGGDSLEVFVQLERSPNGITLSADGAHLFIALRGDVGRVTVSDTSFMWIENTTGTNVDADGLYYYENSIVSVEPYDTVGVVNWYFLNNDGTIIERHQVLFADDPLLDQPTTGTVVGDDFHFIGNSQLQTFKRLFQESGEGFDRGAVADPVVFRVDLE